MKALFAVALLLSAPLTPYLQNTTGNSNSSNHSSQVSMPSQLEKDANEAHSAGLVAEEIDYRQQFSRAKWAAFALDPHSLDEYERYDLVFLNDMPLGLLLEGSHRFAEAETVFRHNRVELASERIAGNDIRSESELQLAHLLASEGNHQEAEKICSYWKPRMRHLAGRQDTDHIYGIPRAPIYDTPEAEVAKWDLACGSPDEGLRLIAEQIRVHPHMLVSFIVLEKYYEAQGNFEMARKAESDGRLAVTSN